MGDRRARQDETGADRCRGSARGMLLLLVAAALVSCTSSPAAPSASSTSMPTTTTAAEPAAATTAASATTMLPGEPSAVLDYLRALTEIRAHAGWRNSGSSGEAEALDFVAATLGGFSQLQAWGLELERQSFPVFAATEPRQAAVYLTVGGRETAVAADAPRGHRFDLAQALRFDSDGEANDSNPDPVEATGPALLIRNEGELADADLNGIIVLLDYGMIGPSARPPREGAEVLARVISGGAAGVVLVTSAASDPEGQPGRLAGDGMVLEGVTTAAVPPVVNLRLEDCGPAGITGWDGLEDVESARLVWDADVSSPGTSGNLVARIPGADQTRAVILGAHIDSPNSPGAIDNGANSAVLLEVARRLDGGGSRPPIDVYLVWFGSEELWLYGSLHFVDTHQELLDRAVGALLLDAIIEPVPVGYLSLDGWSYSRYGDDRLTLASYVEDAAAAEGITIDEVSDFQGIASDNGVFSGFLPQAGLAFGGPTSGYAHTPYDTWEAAAAQADQIDRMTAIALLAATAAGRDLPDLRVTPEPEGRALIVGSHTQAAHMSGPALIDLAMALAWEGLDVDTIPYGREVAPADLEDVSLVVALPAIDYAGEEDADATEAWTAAEVAALADYVERGGLLVLANSARRLVFGRVLDANEDWDGANPLAAAFGVEFIGGDWPAATAAAVSEHPLTSGRSTLAMAAGNGVPFAFTRGDVLAEADGRPAALLIGHGDAGGQVLVLADEGMLGPVALLPPETDNFGFLRNLAAYAAGR